MSEYQPIQWIQYTTRGGAKGRVNLAHVTDLMPEITNGRDDGTTLTFIGGRRIWATEPLNYFIGGRLPAVNPKDTAERLG